MRRRELIENKVIVTHIVEERHRGWRADLFLQEKYKKLSRAKLQSFIEVGKIQIRDIHYKGKRLKPSTLLQVGDEVVVTTIRSLVEPEVDFNYKVLYEDEWLMVIDKPPNLPVHPAGKFLFNSLLMLLRRERPEWKGDGRDFYLIHRIDRETSGVLLLGKTHEAAGHLVHQFRKRTVVKRYYAVVQGHVKKKKFSVDLDLGSDTESEVRLKMAAYPKGTGPLPSLTHFELVRRGTFHDLLECELETGRQHQIRVHCSAIGHPVVGDKLYGGDERLFLKFIETRDFTDELRQALPIKRHALHSHFLSFDHPKFGQRMEIKAPLPADMETLLG